MEKFITNRRKIDPGEVSYSADFVLLSVPKMHMPNKMYLDMNTGLVWYGKPGGTSLKCKDPFKIGIFMFYVNANPPENGLMEILTLLYTYMRDNKREL